MFPSIMTQDTQTAELQSNLSRLTYFVFHLAAALLYDSRGWGGGGEQKKKKDNKNIRFIASKKCTSEYLRTEVFSVQLTSHPDSS